MNGQPRNNIAFDKTGKNIRRPTDVTRGNGFLTKRLTEGSEAQQCRGCPQSLYRWLMTEEADMPPAVIRLLLGFAIKPRITINNAHQ